MKTWDSKTNKEIQYIPTDTTHRPKLSHTALTEQRNLCGMTAAAVNSFSTQHFLSMYLNLRYKWFISMSVTISKKMTEDWKFYQNIYYSLACTLASCNSVYTDTLYICFLSSLNSFHQNSDVQLRKYYSTSSIISKSLKKFFLSKSFNRERDTE